MTAHKKEVKKSEKKSEFQILVDLLAQARD